MCLLQLQRNYTVFESKVYNYCVQSIASQFPPYSVLFLHILPRVILLTYWVKCGLPTAAASVNVLTLLFNCTIAFKTQEQRGRIQKWNSHFSEAVHVVWCYMTSGPNQVTECAQIFEAHSLSVAYCLKVDTANQEFVKQIHAVC